MIEIVLRRQQLTQVKTSVEHIWNSEAFTRSIKRFNSLDNVLLRVKNGFMNECV